MRKLVLLFVFATSALMSQAQTQSATKIGYADVDYIFSQMPEFKQIETELKSRETQLKNQIDSKAKEFQTKLADYNANVGNMLDAVRANTERELQMLQQNLQKLQQDAQTDLQNKQNQLMAPVYEKVGKGIQDVAKENGFTMILSSQIGGLDVVLYADDQNDISDLVLKKFGVTPKSPEGAGTTGTTTAPQAQPKQ